jgi:thioredoxin 1
MAGNVTDIADADFQKQVLESDQPVLVDFWATWCPPCRAIAPHVEALSKKYAGQVRVAKMDVDHNQDTPQKYGIRSIPTLLLFKGGQVVDTIVGAVPASALEERVRKVL